MTQLDKDALNLYRQHQAAQYQRPDTEQGFVGDVVDATQKGAYDGLAGIGETFGLDGVKDWAQEGASDQLKTMSDAGKDALNKQFFVEDGNNITMGEAFTSPRAIAMQIGQVIGMNADILAGGAAIKGGTLAVTQVAKLARNKVIARKGSAEMAEAAAQKATETFLAKKLGNKADQFAEFGKDTLAYGAAGHAVGGGLQAIDLGNEVEAMDFEELQMLPQYQALVRNTVKQMPGADAESILATSRSMLAEEARSAIKTNPALLTSNLLIGGLGTAALTRILSGAMPRGAGIATEFMVEGAQGGIEQIAANQVRQEHINPAQQLDEGVTVSALNEALLGGGVGALAAGVPTAVKAGQKLLNIQPKAANQPPEAMSSPVDDVNMSQPEVGPPAYPSLDNEFEAPKLDTIIDPTKNSMSTFITQASDAAKDHPEFIDGLAAVVGSDVEKAKAAISVLDKFMASPSYRVNAMNRLNEHLGVDVKPDGAAADPATVAAQDADDFNHLYSVVKKDNPQFAEQLKQYVTNKPQKIGLAIDTAGRWLIDPAFRSKAETQLSKFLASPAESAPSAKAEPAAVAAPKGNTNVLRDDAYIAAEEFISSFPLEKRGEIQPDILRDTFSLDDQQINELMPWRTLSDSVNKEEKGNEIKSAIDQAAAQAATSPLNDLPEPTAAQKEAGNYRKGHISVHGLNIAIENAKGSERSGTDPTGKKWSVTMNDHYGYIKKTEGADGDHVDVFVGDNPESEKVFVVDQVNKDGSFDEHKVILGAVDFKSAEDTYKRNYSKGWKIGPVKEMDVAQFKDWLKNGDTTKPVTQRPEWEATVADFGGLRIERYSDKSVVVRGDTKAHKDALKNLKGTFNPRLKGGEGWIYSNSRIDELKKAIPGILGRSDASTQNAVLSAAPESDKPVMFKKAKQQIEALAQRAAVADPALAKRIADILPADMPVSFDAGRVQAEIQKYEKQVAVNEKREAIKATQAETNVSAQPKAESQLGSKPPAGTGSKKNTPLFTNVESSNARAAKLLQAKDDGFNIDKIWHRGSLFDASKYSDSNDDSFFGKGFYLTSDPQEAEDYASTDVTRNMDYTVNAEKIAKAKGITYSEAKAELSKGEKTVAEFVVKSPALLTIGDKGLVFKGRPIGLGAVDIEDILGRAGVSDEEIERLRTQWERVANNDRKLLDNLVGKDGTQGQGYIELLSRRKALPAMREIALSLGADAILMKDGTAPTKQTRKGAEHLVILKPQAVMNISSKPFNDDPATHPKMTLGESRPRSENADAAKPSEVPVKAPDYAADLAELKARADATDDWGLPGDISKLKNTLAELSAIEQAEKLDDIEERIIWEEKSAGIKSPPHKQRWGKMMGQSPDSGKQADSKRQPVAGKLPAKEPAPSKLDAAAKAISEKKLEKALKLKALIASRKGQLNSGIDPEVVLAVAEVGALSIAEGAVKFAQWVRDVMSTTRAVGIRDEDVKPFLKVAYGAMYADPDMYGISDDIADQMDNPKDIRKLEINDLIGDSEAAAPSKGKSLADVLHQKLDEIKDNRQLKAVVAEFNQVAPGQVTAEMMKEAQEAMELALVGRAREIAGTGAPDNEIYAQLVELYKNQPNLNVRSSTSMENMAYSTPAPLAFVTGRLAGVTSRTTVYEPTAGNGMLLITADIENVKANELNSVRADQLRQQGFQVTMEDATEYLPGEKFDAVVMNPPFGRMDAPVKVDGYTIKAIDQLITIKALDAIKDDGKATIIIGASKEAGEIGAADRVFFNYLYSHYNVVDHFEVDGDLYRRQGAGWPVRVIVVHGRQASKTLSPKSGTIERIESWEQLYERYLESVDATVARADASSAARADGAVSGVQRNELDAVTGQDDSEINSADQGRASESRANRSDASVRERGERAGGFRTKADGAAIDGNGKSELTGQSGAVQQEAGVTAGRETTVPAAKPADITGGLGKPLASDSVDSGSSFQSIYPAISKGFNDGALTPVNMAQASQRAMQKMVSEIGDIDAYVTKKLGYDSVQDTHKAFMALQVDTVAAAIYNAEKNNKGIIIADQTGVGKGRQAAGIIRYAIKEGKTPIFVTVTDNLFTDMYNDLIDIGSEDAAPLIVNQDGFIKSGDNKLFKTKSRQAHLKTIDTIISTGKLPDDANILFLTYSQLDGDRQRRLINALKGNAIFVLDEAHNAAGIREKKSEGKVTLTRAGFIYEAIANTPVTYLSATYAKRPDNLPVFYRTDLMDAVDKVEDLVDAVAAGGESLQTLIAGMLAESGQLYRRERSFEGIKIDTIVDHENESAHEVLADRVTEGLRAIVDADEAFHNLAVDVLAEQYQDEGGSARGAGNRASSSVEHSNFTSIVHNFISQLLIGLKVKPTVDKAIALKKAGIKPVIALQNTMGAFLNGFVADNGLNIGDEITADYRDVLLKALDRTRRISVTDSQGNAKAIDVQLSQLPDDVRQLYIEAQEVIQELDLSSIPLSPIDYVRDELEKAGIRTSEITGRGYRIDYSTPVPTLSQRSADEQNDKRGTVDAFNDGRLDALVLNVAGSTGLSIHAAEKFKDKSPRHMIVMQAMADINILMQMLGRINRTGQVELPAYSMLSLAIPAEKRPAARTSKKFKSLNAQTSANTDSDVNLKAQDMMNKYGDKVMSAYLKENPDIARMLSLGVPSGDSVQPALYEKATGRMALLPVKMQKEIYEEIEAEYTDLIEYLDKTGLNDLEPKTMDLDAKIIESKVVYEGKAPGTIFGGHTFLHQVNTKYQGKPPSAADVIKALAKVKDPEKLVQSILKYKHRDKAYAAAIHKNAQKLKVELQKAEAKALGKEDSKLSAKVIEAQAAYDRAEKAVDSFESSVQAVEQALSRYKVGHHFSIQLPEETVNGVVVAIKDTHREGKGNPFSPSKLKFTFMVDSGIRQIDLTVAQLTGEGSIPVLHTFAPNEEQIHTTFQPTPKGSERREIRYIATGNAIMGSKKLGGRIITFTDDKGGVHQGILMPKNYSGEQFSGVDSGGDFALRDMVVLAKFLRANRSMLGEFGIADASNSVRLLPMRDNQWKIVIPKANRSQAVKDVKFSESLQKAMGSEFFGGSATMVATFDDTKLSSVLPELDKLAPMRGLQSYRDAWVAAGGNALPSAAISFDGKDIAGKKDAGKKSGGKSDIVFSKSNRLAAKPPKGVPAIIVEREAEKILSKLNGAAGIRVKVLKTQAEAEAIWRMKLDGDAVRGAYSKSTRTAYVIAENIRNMSDLQQTLAHEIVAHGGLDTVIGADAYNDFINKIQKTRSNRSFASMWQQIDRDYEGSTERDKAEEVFAYYVQHQPVEPNIKLWWAVLTRWVEKALQKVGLLPAGAAGVDAMQDMIHSIRLGFAAGRARQSVKDALAFQLTGSSRLGMHFKDVVKRVPELKSAAQKMKAGELSAAEYELLVNEYKPVTPYASTPGLATTQEMQKALDSNKVAKIGEPYKQLATGDVVGLRLDIPSYSNHGVWVVSVHEGKKGGKGGAAGKVIGYDSAAMVSNPNMGMAEKSTLQIAAGESKGTIATIGGAWVSKSPDEIAALAEQALTSKDWVQVGMDPERHSYFYDRKSMEPVVSGEEAIQVGGLVLVKNPVYGRKGDFLFSQGADNATDSPNFKRWFGDSKIVNDDGSPRVVYHGSPSGDIKVFQSAVELGLTGYNVRPYDTAGLYFSPNKDLANAFARNFERGGNGSVYPVYLSMKNPLVVGDGEVLTAGVKGALNRLIMGGKKFAAEQRLNDFRSGTSRTSGISSADIKILKDAGYDGVINEADFEYIVFEPNQIKSAIGNNGDFDPSNPDIRFSKSRIEKTGNAIADAVSQINAERMQRWAEVFKPTKIRDAVKAKWPDWRPAMLQLLPRNYLADIGGDLLPSLRRYNNQVAAMEAQRNNLLNMTHGTADKWRKLVGKDSAASARLADLMHEATLIGVDPSMDKFYPSITRQTYQMLMSRAKAFIKSRNGEAEAVSRGMQRRARIQAAMDKVPVQEQAYDQLRADFLALPAEYQRMFIEVRDSYLEMNRERKKALEQRIEDLIADKRVAAAQISIMREEFELNELNGIYFPLQRFGKYRAVVKDRETGEVHSYSMFETNAQMQQWMAEQRGDGVVVDGGYQFEYSKMMDGVSAGFMKDLLLKFSPVFSQNNRIQDDLYQLFLEHSPDLSVRKHMIHRKGVSGYDQDALRAFAHNQFHTAYQIAKVSNTHHMQSHILAMEDEARALVNTDDKVRAVQVVNELQQRNEWILNPKGSEWANKLTGWGFFWYLGTTPAAALVNITQTAMVGLPVLGARYTYKEAASMLASTSAAFFKGKGNVDKTLTGRELSAFRQLEESGIIDKTMAHDMTGIADGGVAYSPKYHKVMQYAGFMFHHAERFNREVTAMAAYKLAFAKFMKKYAGQQGAEGIAHRDAVAEAIEMTKLSHFDYANSNRPRFMQGDMARVILLFRQHSVNMTYRLIRDTQQSIWGRGEDKKIAQKQLAGMLGMTMLFAGAAGLPLYSVIAGIFNTLLDDEDEPFDFDAAVKEHLAEAIGEAAASVIMNGAPGTATGADLTNRIGMNNLWFRDPEADLEGEAAVQYYAEQALGPMYGILAGWGKAKQLAREGHTGRAWEAGLPKFARDLFKSARYADEGVLTKRGDPIIDELSPWQIALQANGFTPLEVSQQYSKNNALATSARRIMDRRKLLLNRYALARRHGDDLLVAETLAEMEVFNLAQPTLKITAANRVKSLEQRKKLSESAVNGVILSKKLTHLAE